MSDKIPASQLFIPVKAHAGNAVFTFIIGTVLFPWLIAKSLGGVIFSIVTALIYFIVMFSTGYDIAERDLKPYTQEEPKKFKGLILSVSVIIVSILLFILYRFTWSCLTIDNSLATATAWINNMIFIIWCFPFFGLIKLSSGNMSVAGYIIVLLLPVISLFLGYLAGFKRIDISSKLNFLIFEKKSDEKKKND